VEPLDNFKIIYKILKILEAAMDYEELDTDSLSPERLGITENRYNAIIMMLIDSGYIKGVDVIKSIGGTSLRMDRAQITLKGLEYLNENSTMKKMANLAKGIKESISGL
jgi:hypothetical protein